MRAKKFLRPCHGMAFLDLDEMIRRREFALVPAPKTSARVILS